MVCDSPWVSWTQLCSPGLLTVREAEEALSLLSNNETSLLSTVSSTNPNHSHTPATVKKTNSIPAKPSTPENWLLETKSHLAQSPRFGICKFQSAVDIPVLCCSHGKELTVLSSACSDYFCLGPNNNLEIKQCEQCRLPKDKDNRV